MISEEKIKSLIKKGFKLEVISFEFEISMDILKKYEQELKNEAIKSQSKPQIKVEVPKTKLVNTKSKVDKEKQNKIRVIQSLIGNYNRLYNEERKEEKQELPTANDEQQKMIDFLLDSIKKLTDQTLTYESSLIVIKRVQMLEMLPVSIDELESLYNLLAGKDKDFFGKIQVTSYKVSYNLGVAKSKIVRKLAEAIDIKAKQTDNLEELEALNKKLKFSMGVSEISAVNNRISEKTLDLKKKKYMEEFLNSISPALLKIVDDLEAGSLDVAEAKRVLENESNTSNIAIKQLYIKIKMQIERRGALKNPSKTIKQLAEVTGENVINSLNAVVTNLINNNEFEVAKALCRKCRKLQLEDFEYQTEIRSCEQSIFRSEIAYLFLKMISEEETEQVKTFDVLKEKLSSHNVVLSGISLGKTKDNSKTISLSDVFGTRENEFLKDRN